MDDSQEDDPSEVIKIVPIAEDDEFYDQQSVNEKSDLDLFRIQWKEELDQVNKKNKKSVSTDEKNLHKCDASSSSSVLNQYRRLPVLHEHLDEEQSVENQNEKNDNVGKKKSTLTEEEKLNIARTVYLKGGELERSGRYYEAIKAYKKATLLIPDIDRRIIDKVPTANDNSQEASENEDEIDSSLANGGLYLKLTNHMNTQSIALQPDYPIPNQKAHISFLPREILEYILLWIVGSELDTRSLNSFAAVCREFYVLSWSENLWKKACQRVWGPKCHIIALEKDSYEVENCVTWREMFLNRPQPRYNGCYISKTTYFRSGESNFHDSTYQPWHLVSYFRLLRFFVGGTVLMLTSSDSIQSLVNHLAYRDPKSSLVLSGTYRLEGSFLYLNFIRHSDKKLQHSYGSRKHRRQREYQNSTDVEKTELDITYELVNSSKGRRNWFLGWREYTVTSHYIQGGKSNPMSIDVTNGDNFPQLSFSRVKSYMRESTEPLI